MDGFKEFGVGMTGLIPVREAVDMAKKAEDFGMGSVWFAEDYFFRGGIPYLSAAAMATEKIRIGLGVVNPYSRHPALMAMEFATVDEMANQRTVFGLGSGVPYWMKQMGYAFIKPLSRTRECVDLVRKILKGNTVNFKGEFFEAKEVQLIFKPVRTNPPIFLAFEGKQGLKLTGEIGDGAILSIFNTPRYVEFAWKRVEKGAKQAGKSLDDFEMVSFLPIVIDDDLDKAIGISRKFAALYLPHSQPGGPLMEFAGITAEDTESFSRAAEKGEDVGSLITDKMVRELSIVGDIESCTHQLEQLIRSGVNTPVMVPVPGTDPVETAKTIALKIADSLQ